MLGLDLLPWELNVIGPWLATDDLGHWICRTNGLSAPRQNGKTGGTVRPFAAYCMFNRGEKVLYTSHEQRTSTETFEEFLALFDTKVMSKYLKKVQSALGREGIWLKNGARITFQSRTNKSGRGIPGIDLLIVDEAQLMTDGQLSALLPTQKRTDDPHAVFSGTPPTPETDGGVFRRIRRRCINGETPKSSWAEFGIQEIPKDIGALEVWYATNPSLGTLILEDAIANDYSAMTSEQFEIEDLGYWYPDEKKTDSAIPLDAWKACALGEPIGGGNERIAYGVKFDAVGSTYSVSAAVRTDDGVMVECIDRASCSNGIAGLTDWLMQRGERLSTLCVDGKTWAPTLFQRLIDGGFPKKALHVMKASEVSEACGMLAAAVQERSVGHMPQPLLEESVESSPKRPIGREGWAFDGPDPTPIESCALAYWGVMTTKRNPNRRMQVSF